MPKSVIAADRNHVNVADMDDLATLRADMAKLRERVEALEGLAENPAPPEPHAEPQDASLAEIPAGEG